MFQQIDRHWQLIKLKKKNGKYNESFEFPHHIMREETSPRINDVFGRGKWYELYMKGFYIISYPMFQPLDN